MSDIEEQLVETWNIHDRINRYLLEAVPDELLGSASAAKHRTILQLFAHMHNVRLMWLKPAAVPIPAISCGNWATRCATLDDAAVRRGRGGEGGAREDVSDKSTRLCKTSILLTNSALRSKPGIFHKYLRSNHLRSSTGRRPSPRDTCAPR